MTVSAGLTVARDTGSADTTVTVRLGLAPSPLPFPIDLVSELPRLERERPEFRSRLRDWGEQWSDSLVAELEAQRRELWRSARPVRSAPDAGPPGADRLAEGAPEADTDTTPPVVPPPEPGPPADDGQEPDVLPDVLDQYADLGFSIDGRVEFGGGWNRFRPCDVTVQLNCDPGLVPTLTPDIQLGARVGGTVTDRIHVNVDYDNRREFDAANNINVYYQGLEDEILQRIEVGDVSFQLPRSRYLTQGIPSGNFGLRATGQMGPVEFQTVWAQQKGDVGTRELLVGGGGQGFEQDAVTILDDADYERGRFFFLFNPRRLSGHPHVEIQRLLAFDAPASIRPASTVKVYRYEAFTFGIENQIPEGFVNAIAVAVDTITTAAGTDSVVADTLSGLFRPLVAGEDYVLHQSGLWLQLRNTLADREGLAVTYRAADGTEIGTFNAEEVSDAHTADPENVDPPVLELIKGVNHRPGTATWTREMHHVYRVSASPGVVASSVELTVSQGDPELGNTFRAAPDGTQLEFIKIFGLDDDPTDNRLDASQLYETLDAGPDATAAGPTGTYIVFPTLEPFRAPPPLTGAGSGLDGAPFPLSPGDANAVIYDEPNDQVRRGASLYQLTIAYKQRFEGFLSTISLGAVGVREGSERLTIDGVELVRDEDYTIDYDIGQIELRDPERWFRNNPSARIRATFEQKPLFQLAPTTVFGFQARYALGSDSELNLIGLSQTEKTLQTRPELGLEPSSVQLGGVSGRLDFRPDWLTGLVDGLPGVEAETPSSVSIDGELAFSMPTTNTQGVTYVEDFEGGPGFNVSMASRSWRLGAAPSTIAGAEMSAPVSFQADNASELVWQDQYVVSTSDGGDQIVGGLLPSQIDQELRIQGAQRPEAVLFFTVREPENRRIAPVPSPPAGAAWRSITTVLSPNGQDFTPIEFLEFYVAATDAQADSMSLIFDLGTVSEDAFGIDSLGVGSGLGSLNREVEPPRIWSDADDVGLWGSGCLAQRGLRAYPPGDVRANCTRQNGLEDSEDLNQNGILDGEERFFRYTVDLGDPGNPYFVRYAEDFGSARFRLFRIPLRRPDHRERVSDAEFQNIRHLRLTVVSRSGANIVLARARFVGSRWLKRGRAGVVRGLSDTTSAPSPGAQVEVGPISTLDSRYVPPPGITDEVANRTDQFSLSAAGFNEQSLSIQFDEVGPDERAEVYLQYPQTPRDFLAYRSMNLWALGAGGPWAADAGPLSLVVKLGEDARNFYMYRTSLPAVPPDAQGAELRQAWLPEIEIDFERFIVLRARAEEIMLDAGGLPGDTVLRVWDTDVFPDGDSSYAVVISQRSRGPNLAAVRQLSLGVHNSGATPIAAGELWVDDMRLGSTVDNTGLVGRLNVDIQGSDLFTLSASYASENPYFRQLAQDPSFRSSGELRFGGRLQMGRFMPSNWQLDMPVTVSYSNAGSRPTLLPRTDLRGDRLPGLRTPLTRNFRADVALSKRGRTDLPVVGGILDNSTLRFSYDQRRSRNSRSLTDAGAFTAGYSYRSDVGDVSFPILPGFLGKLFFFLPSSVRDARLRLTPRALQLSANYVDSETQTRRFQEIVELPGDADAGAIDRFDHRLQTSTTLTLAPLSAMTGRFTYTQDRELVPSRELVESPAGRRLLEDERASLGGVDVGWELGRTISTNLTYRPNLAPWLTPQASVDTRFNTGRNASFVTVRGEDTTLVQDFTGYRALNGSVAFNPPAFLHSLLGDDRSGFLGALLDLIDRLDIISASVSRTLGSHFSRREASPTLGYQLGLGNFSAFRVQDGDTASRVNEYKSKSLNTGVQLPLGASLSLDYSQTDRLTWSSINQSIGTVRTWPNVRLNWTRIPLPSVVGRWVRTLGIRTGYTFRTTSDQVVGADQDRETEVATIPINVNLALNTGWMLNYNLTISDTERRDPTGLTRGDNANHSVQVTAQFRPISSGGTFRNPIRASLRYTQNDREECRQLGGAFGGDGVSADCEPFTDLRIRRVDFTLDTDVPPFILGVQAAWNDRQSDLGQRIGSTQLEVSVFGQFVFESGVIR